MIPLLFIGCLSWTDNDLDGDGYLTDDCDDSDPTIHPGARELAGDSVDSDCDGLDGVDGDGDGQASKQSGGQDCNDDDPAIFYGADERCDLIDNDCDGVADEPGALDGQLFYRDKDDDLFGDEAQTERRCSAEPGWVRQAGDCDDSDASISPDAVEDCDDADNDCDDVVDGSIDWFEDRDADGYGTGAPVSAPVCSPPDGYVRDDTDCDDTSALNNPAAEERCADGIDNDCDSLVDYCLLESLPKVLGPDPAADNFSARISAGDLNGDGQADLLVSADSYLDADGAIWLVPGPLIASQDASDALPFWLPPNGHQLNTDTYPLDDLNGDAYPDALFTGTDDEGHGVVYLLQGPITASGDLNDAIQIRVQDGATVGRGLIREASEDSVRLWLSSPDAGDGGQVYSLTGPLTASQELSAETVWSSGDSGSGLGSLMSAGDLDGDGVMDRAVWASSTQEIWLYEDNASAPDAILDQDPFEGLLSRNHLVIGDLNRDGVDDLVFGTALDSLRASESGTVRLWLGRTTWESGGFSALSDASIIGEEQRNNVGQGLSIGDIDGDGWDELIVSTGESLLPEATDSTRIFSGLDLVGSVPLSAARQVVCRYSTGFAVDDLNGDGRPELALSSSFHNTVRLLQWDGP
ncbi:MAG: MopE-related protein [Myxococcota bacterium]